MVGTCNGNRPYTPCSVAGLHALFRLATFRASTCDRLEYVIFIYYLCKNEEL